MINLRTFSSIFLSRSAAAAQSPNIKPVAAVIANRGYFYTPHTLCTIGQKTVTVVYNDLSVTFDVTVEPLEPTLTLQNAPDKTAYLIGEVLETAGLTLVSAKSAAASAKAK